MKRKKWSATGGTVILYRDNLVRLVVDVSDAVKNRRWMKEFKECWKTRLDQLELRTVSYRIEIE